MSVYKGNTRDSLEQANTGHTRTLSERRI